ncbi:MAG TPA: flippase [Acidimicrobiales bacterium]|nr:flippase [Acidimicrobiales bacterium]
MTILVARLLGPEAFGIYAFALSAVALVAPMLDVGQTVLVRDLVLFPEQRSPLLAAAFRVGFALAAVAQIAAVVVALVLPESLGEARAPVVIGALGLLVRPLLVVDYWFQSRLDATPAASARLTGLAVGSTLRIVLAIVGGPHVIPLLVATTVIEPIVTAAIMLPSYRRRGGEPRKLLTERAPAWPYFLRIAPLLVAGLSIALYMRLDQVMLGLMAGPGEVSEYAVAARLSEFSYFLPLVLSASLAPGLSALHARDPEAFTALYDRVMGGFVALALVLVAGLVGFAPMLVSVLFGDQYAPAGEVLRVHALSLPFVFIGIGQTVWNTVYDQQTLAMWRTLGGAVINTVLNLLLIPSYGALGAAWATVVAYAFAGFLGNGLSRRTWPFLAMQARQFWPPHLIRNLASLRHDVFERLRPAAVV